jgi:hypothetical protein
MNWQQVSLVLLLVAGGCSGSPQRVNPPEIDPSTAAAAAMETYDTDHDGKLSNEELMKCPGVLISMKKYDVNGDKAIDAAEFEQRLTQLLKNKTGATQLACHIVYQGKSLPGATVVLEPEPYLGDEIQAAEGVTSNSGMADVGMPAENAPEALKNLKLIQYGTFKVRVTHPTIQIPAKYNTDTTLGYETIPGEPTASFTLN